MPQDLRDQSVLMFNLTALVKGAALPAYGSDDWRSAFAAIGELLRDDGDDNAQRIAQAKLGVLCVGLLLERLVQSMRAVRAAGPTPKSDSASLDDRRLM